MGGALAPLLSRIEERLCGDRNSCWGGSWIRLGARGCAPVPLDMQNQRSPAPSVWGAPLGSSSASTSSSKFVVFSGAGSRLGDSDADTSKNGNSSTSGAQPGASEIPGVV